MEAFSKNHKEMDSGQYDNIYVDLDNVKYNEITPKV